MFAETVFPVVLSIALAYGTLAPAEFDARAFVVPSASMAPTMLPGDYVISSLRPTVDRGDVIAFAIPKRAGVVYTKRVIGLPGDRVRLVAGVVWINGRPSSLAVEGDYTFVQDGLSYVGRRYRETLPNGRSHEIVLQTNLAAAENTSEVVVPADALFVLGDNRDNSLDSRFPEQFGFAPTRDVIARMRWIYWSKDLFRLFHGIQ